MNSEDWKDEINQMNLKQLVDVLQLVADGIGERVRVVNSQHADPGLMTRLVMFLQAVEWFSEAVGKRIKGRWKGPARAPAATAGDSVRGYPDLG